MGATTGGRIEKAGIAGRINGYDVLVLGDAVIVARGGERVAKREVAGLGRFVEGAKDLKLGWARLPDFEVVYLYDAGDGGFGYALNLHDEWLSEWGYAPFAVDEDAEVGARAGTASA